jgi:predicted enzyme related to lactoylglutathione lyase
MSIRYAHTNIVAHDWRRLADFYIKVLDCERVPPERDYRGEMIGKIAGLPPEHATGLKGIHLRLPGHGENGPTLEIFQYVPDGPGHEIHSNTKGFSHIAFAVDDVKALAAQFVEHGGREVGEYVAMDVEGAGHIKLHYMADPEGNIVELQNWTPLAEQ